MPKKLNKTYFGIPKTPIDNNTVFYASLDGTTKAEVGGTGIENGVAKSFTNSPTGLGLYAKDFRSVYEMSTPLDVFTIDMIFKVNTFTPVLTENSPFLGVANARFFTISKDGYLRFTNTNVYKLSLDTYYHVRLSQSLGNMYFYVNGKLVLTIPSSLQNVTITKFMYGGWFDSNGLPSTTANIYLCDLSISNIDRGDYFPTLPQDFIEGYASIVPSFNNQRQVYADSLTSEYKKEIVKFKQEDNPSHIKVLNNPGQVWRTGDQIKIKGLTGEIISGVIDTDTALARVVSSIDSSNFILDDVTKLSVGDKIYVIYSDLSYKLETTINAIDVPSKRITTPNTFSVSGIIGAFIVETTVSSSTPLVKYRYNDPYTEVLGTWNGLGTNEATFTIGADNHPALMSQDIEIHYSLNEVPGQGQIPVLDEVIEAEIKGKKLVVNPTVHVTDDFNGKIFGSTVECPHKQFNDENYTTLKPPSDFTTETSQARYSMINKLDNITSYLARSTNGVISQQLFSFNLVELIERKYGTIKALDKIQWIKDNISRISIHWYGYGNSPIGNKATLNVWNGSTWVSVTTTSYHTSDTISKISGINHYSTALSNTIDTNGFSNYLVYADPSDGVTASTIYTDYVNLEVTLKVPTGYDVLVSENTSSREMWRVTKEDLVGVNDFTNKVSGSVAENPHIAKGSTNSDILLPPNSFSSEFADTNGYVDIKTLNGIIKATTTTVNTKIAQHLFSFNLVELVERKYGKIPSTNKVQWLKDNTNSLMCSWWGYGSCPTGNKAYFKHWRGDIWNDSYAGSNTSSSSSVIKLNVPVSLAIQSDGFAHYIAYTDPSNGTTASTINTDYVSCEIVLKESAIRKLDYFKNKYNTSNILLVRKETKEVQTYFSANNEDGIALYGRYKPYQGQGDIIIKAKILAVGDPIITTVGTGGAGQDTLNLGYNAISSKFPTLIEDYKLTGEMFKADGSNVNIDELILKPYTYTSIGSTTRFTPSPGMYIIPGSTLGSPIIRGVNKRPILINDTVPNGNGQMSLRMSLPTTIPSEALVLVPILVTESGKVYLVILSTKKTLSLDPNGLHFYVYNTTYDVYNLKNRPLIK